MWLVKQICVDKDSQYSVEWNQTLIATTTALYAMK